MASVPAELTLVSVDGLLPGASNATLLARDADGTPWVYKPARGERPLWDFPQGTLGVREIACFRLSEALSLDVVPETFPAEGPYGPGSAQRFLDEDMAWDPRPLIVAADESLWPVVMLDLLANNADRKIGHLLREPGNNHIWAIDNGLSFHPDEKLRTVMWAFSGHLIPERFIDRLDQGTVTAALTGLLDDIEIEATLARLESLRSQPIHPPPPEDRPAMPWPLW